MSNQQPDATSRLTLDHVLDGLGLKRNRLVNLERLVVRAHELDLAERERARGGGVINNRGLPRPHRGVCDGAALTLVAAILADVGLKSRGENDWRDV